MSRFDLRAQAGQFAAELSGLLNGTVCDGIRISAVMSRSGYPNVNVGYGITKDQQDVTQGIPVTLGKKPPTCYLGMAIRLEPDDEQTHMAVTASFMGLFTGPDLDDSKALLHYDYERGKADDYPEAHLQVCASSASWTDLCERAGLGDRPLQRLHLPVGGRRFRPTLEDLVHFLIVEKLADPREGWEREIADGRERFRVRQLKAAIRRDPDSAREALRELETGA